MPCTGAAATSTPPSNVAVTAARCAFQRELEAAGFVARQHYRPALTDVAKDAQKAVKLRASEIGGERPDRMAYEEARWQLIETIRGLRNPHDGASG